MADMKTLTLNGTLYEVNDETARTGIDNMKPLVLNADDSSTYESDSTYGDEALAAILAGRQILVRTPNADGGTYTAIFSPILTYQLPNVDNNYLYLFYLRDEKQDLDLTAAGLGTIQMPVYGELKMLLSQTYTECPLS